MTLIFEIAVVVCLAVIALQLHEIRRLKQLELERQEQYRQTAELNEFLKAKFPNLFYDAKELLAEWVHTLERNKERLSKSAMEPVNEDRHEDDRWEDVLHRAGKRAVEHQRKYPHDEKILPDFSRMCEVSEQFVRDARSSTNLTEAEIEFLLFRLWNIHKDSISGTLEPPLFEYILKTQQETLQEYLSRYGKAQRGAEQR
jgi:hypothetical protein